MKSAFSLKLSGIYRRSGNNTWNLTAAGTVDSLLGRSKSGAPSARDEHGMRTSGKVKRMCGTLPNTACVESAPDLCYLSSYLILENRKTRGSLIGIDMEHNDLSTEKVGAFITNSPLSVDC